MEYRPYPELELHCSPSLSRSCNIYAKMIGHKGTEFREEVVWEWWSETPEEALLIFKVIEDFLRSISISKFQLLKFKEVEE